MSRRSIPRRDFPLKGPKITTVEPLTRFYSIWQVCFYGCVRNSRCPRIHSQNFHAGSDQLIIGHIDCSTWDVACAFVKTGVRKYGKGQPKRVGPILEICLGRGFSVVVLTDQCEDDKAAVLISLVPAFQAGCTCATSASPKCDAFH